MNHFSIKKFLGANGCPREFADEKKNMENKLFHSMIMAEFMFKCHGGMSKQDYARCRHTHDRLSGKYNTLIDTMLDDERESFIGVLDTIGKDFSILP